MPTTHQGLKILDPRRIRESMVIGDLAIIIRLVCYSSSSNGNLQGSSANPKRG
jgi:hypothetical protein